LSDVSWTVVSTYPPISSDNNDDSSFVNDLDQLVGEFTAGTSACQVDSVGNFVWLTSKSAVKTSDSSLTATISNTPKGIQYVVSSSGSGGAWSSISTSGLNGSSTYLWDDQANKVGALFSIAPGVFVHALGSTLNANITLGLLTAGGNLTQSSQTWQVREKEQRKGKAHSSVSFVVIPSQMCASSAASRRIKNVFGLLGKLAPMSVLPQS